ncbi:MAG: DUF4430 domain-containing protein, partial [Peptostreptococcaceae bacterium]|nr:DUF4430 domain-containing protein [Peptostreptococcaceae bacterium]
MNRQFFGKSRASIRSLAENRKEEQQNTSEASIAEEKMIKGGTMFTKSKWQSFRKILSVYLAVLMIVGMMPMSSFADTPTTDSVKVTLTIDGQTHRNVLLGEKFLDEQEFTVPKGQTLKDLILAYCQKNDVKYTLNGESYLSSLHGLTEKEYGDLSGWTYRVLDKDKNKYVMANVMFDAYKLEKDEKIKFVYTIDNFWNGYGGEKKKAAETTKALVGKIDKDKMSGYLAAALFNTGGDVPDSYKNVARAKVAELKKGTSSVADHYEVILAVLASGENPYAAWGRDLIAEVAEYDILNGSIEDMIYAIAIVNSGQFVLPENTTWDVKKVKTALEARQNEDGSFGEGSDIEKVIRTARVFNFAEFDSFSKVRNNMEDYLAGQMHRGGGLPLSKEDLFATAEVVLARANRSQDPDERLSYRVIGNWNAGDKPSPYKALLDFCIESQGGFKKDYLDKNIDPSTFEIGTLAMIRTDKRYNDSNYAGKSLFKFGKVEPPQDGNDFKLWADRTYEEIVVREKANADISEESGYILRRMGEELSAEQVKVLEGKTNPAFAPFAAYKAVLASIAAGNGKERENIGKVMEAINAAANSRYNSPNAGAWVMIAAYGTGAKLSEEKDTHIRSKLLPYTLFQPNKDIKIEDNHIYFAGAITLMDEKAAQENYAKNIEKLIRSKTKAELTKNQEYIPSLATALNLLGEDITDAKYMSKDGAPFKELLQASDKNRIELFFALASYKLKQQDGSNLYKYSFEQTMDERVAQTVEKYADRAKLDAHILKKYDDRDVGKTVEETKAALKKASYVYDPGKNIKVWFDLMAGGENLQNIDGHDLLDNITKKKQLNQKIKNINSLIVLNSADYKIDPADPENRDTLKTKVLAIKEFKEDSTGRDRISDAGKAMIALAPYYKTNDPQTVQAIDAFLAKVSKAMQNDGTVAEFGNNIPLSLPYHSSDHANLVQGLIHLGIDPHTDARFIKNGRSLLDGLFSYETANGFAMKHGGSGVEDSLYTRAAVETLLDYRLFKQGKKLIYDHSDLVIPPIGERSYVITFRITPEDAKDATLVVTEKAKTDVIAPEQGEYKLKAGDYKVEAKKSGYKTLVKEFTVSDDAATHLVELQLEKAEETPFKFNENTQTITGYKTKDVPQELEIPAEINGIAVKKIGVEAFKYSDTPSWS